jgi:hypothetical protein
MDDLPVIVSAATVFSSQLFKDAETPRQEEANRSVNKVLEMKDLQNVVNVILTDLHKLWKQHVMKVSSPKLTAFYSACHQYAVSDLYPKFSRFSSDGQKASLSKCFMSLRERFVLKLSEATEQASSSSSTVPVMSDAGKGKVRYLAGRAVVKARKRCMEAVRNTICKPRHKERFRTANMKLHHLQFMRTNVHAVTNGKHAASLEETERRQNVGGGLTHVKDSVYECFLHLETLRGKVHTIERAKLLKGNILEDSLTRVKSDKTLKEMFSNLFLSMKDSEFAIVQLLFDDLVNGYMMVANNEFRKKVSAALGKRRKLRHRAAVLVGAPQPSTSSAGDQAVIVSGKRGRGRGQMSRRGGRRKRGSCHDEETEKVNESATSVASKHPRGNRGRTRRTRGAKRQSGGKGSMKQGSGLEHVIEGSEEELEVGKVSPETEQVLTRRGSGHMSRRGGRRKRGSVPDQDKEKTIESGSSASSKQPRRGRSREEHSGSKEEQEVGKTLQRGKSRAKCQKK